MAPNQTVSARTGPAVRALGERIERLESLDGPAEKVATAVFSALGSRKELKDALSGVWLGHALHPVLTDIPIGTWLSATLLDLVGGDRSGTAAERLTAIGIAAALPAAVSGASDWADSSKVNTPARRVGAVHGVANTGALGLYAASLAARRRGRRGLGAVLGLTGLAAVTVSGMLGGQLSYALGVGVDETTFEPRAEDWTAAIADDELSEREARAVEVSGAQVLLVRQDGRLFALSDVCCHRGGPLHDGEIADGCVECPWHGSVFRLEDGAIVRGPAAYPQPAYDVRVREGTIEVRAR